MSVALWTVSITVRGFSHCISTIEASNSEDLRGCFGATTNNAKPLVLIRKGRRSGGTEALDESSCFVRWRSLLLFISDVPPTGRSGLCNVSAWIRQRWHILSVSGSFGRHLQSLLQSLHLQGRNDVSRTLRKSHSIRNEPRGIPNPAANWSFP